MPNAALSSALGALLFGALSAASLVAGAWVGIFAKPAQRLTAAIMAFGAGALFAALSLELVGEALERLHGGFWPVGLGCLAGGLVFVLLDRLVNQGGGFLRKQSTLSRHIGQDKKRDARRILASLGKVSLFASLPPEEMHGIVAQVERTAYPPGSRVISAGEEGRELYIVEEGQLEVSRGGQKLAVLGKGQVVGEMALLSGELRTADVTALGAATLLIVRKADFDRLLGAYPALKAEVERIAGERRGELARATMDGEEWAKRAERSAGRDFKPSSIEMAEEYSKAAEVKGGAPMAIWLGILLDGIPESAVIGASMIGETKVSLALILGLFIANFPEAMSSSVGMRKMGMSPLKISLLWLSIVALTGIGAAIGNMAFRSAPPELVALFESLAAGAMLAMLAETMMPEAFEQGGSVTGISTILGFLAAVFLRTI